jgi:predicted acetyltransferase
MAGLLRTKFIEKRIVTLPSDPLVSLLPEQTAKPIEHSRWMLRILDPVRALSMRGHAREGEARVRVRVIRSSATSCCSASYEAGE